MPNGYSPPLPFVFLFVRCVGVCCCPLMPIAGVSWQYVRGVTERNILVADPGPLLSVSQRGPSNVLWAYPPLLQGRAQGLPRCQGIFSMGRGGVVGPPGHPLAFFIVKVFSLLGVQSGKGFAKNRAKRETLSDQWEGEGTQPLERVSQLGFATLVLLTVTQENPAFPVQVGFSPLPKIVVHLNCFVEKCACTAHS